MLLKGRVLGSRNMEDSLAYRVKRNIDIPSMHSNVHMQDTLGRKE
jgi:hypothetical protein